MFFFFSNFTCDMYTLGETEKMNMFKAINNGLALALEADQSAGN